MPRHRQMIPVATSAFFLVCLMLHAQTGLSLQSVTLYNDGEANKAYESLKTVTVAQARRLITNFHLKPPAFNADGIIATFDKGRDRRGNLCDGGAFYVLEYKDGLWEKMRWMETSCPWAS